ncbi:ATP-binding protein [Streptomyces sp. NBC_00576]|uniref:ATP-binding protein n=1 Tax=Streptomyces sp. NBC_00576 TaxID=2903665 RepID=UPI002E812098|nr:ATP-binding protein [Streptomyces sp. NBC_00576]WUB72199.1 ATP-binding protein [Streptomyces sp. NBC_00576]
MNATTTADFGAELLAVPKAVPELRRAVREWFGEDAYGRVGGDVQLCVTELVGNVVRHVGEGTPVSVRVGCVDGARIRVAVGDPDPRALPVLLSATGADESGRGLALLGALAVRWGVEVEAGGKTVWCELEGAGVPRAMERRREQERLGELVAWMEEKGGPVTEEEMAAAEAEWREVGRIFAERERERDVRGRA